MRPDLFRSRLARHILLWVLAWLYIRYINYGLYVPDTDRMLTTLSAIELVRLLGLFYLFGYVVFPRYLYRFRPVPLLAATGLIYYGTYLMTWVAAYFLHDLSRPNPGLILYHTHRGWTLFRQAGLLGCFTNPMAALLGVFNSGLYVVELLVPKLIKDLLAYRTRALLLEQNRLKLAVNNLALEQQNLRLELELLRAQVNPHFLFNALNGIYSQVVDADKTAAELVLRLTELLRYTLYEAHVSRIALADELAYITNYLCLERIRHASLMEVIVPTDGSTDGEEPGDYRIAPMLLIAVVEQAVTSSLLAGSQRAYVLVDTHVDNGTFFLTVQHSIPPARPSSSVASPTGADLSAVEKRLAALYPGRHRLDVSRTPTRQTVNLRLDLDPAA